MAIRYRFGNGGLPHFITFGNEWPCANNINVAQYFGLETWVFKRDLSDPLEHLNERGANARARGG